MAQNQYEISGFKVNPTGSHPVNGPTGDMRAKRVERITPEMEYEKARSQSNILASSAFIIAGYAVYLRGGLRDSWSPSKLPTPKAGGQSM